MPTLTTSLSKELIERLDTYSKKLQIPKNQFIERSLTVFFEQLKRAEYIASYKNICDDADITSIAEEGMVDYLRLLDAWDK